MEQNKHNDRNKDQKEEILKRSSDEIIAMAIRDVLIREREKREKQ